MHIHSLHVPTITTTAARYNAALIIARRRRVMMQAQLVHLWRFHPLYCVRAFLIVITDTTRKGSTKGKMRLIHDAADYVQLVAMKTKSDVVVCKQTIGKAVSFSLPSYHRRRKIQIITMYAL